MYKMYEMELAGRTLRVDVDRVAKQANGAVLMHYGDTTVLCTSTASEKPRDLELIFSLLVLNITKDFTLSEKSREDLIKEKGKHPKTQF